METTENAFDFSVKTHVFEGPLELLLELVEKRKLLINDISLASVTDEYMATVAKMQELSLPNTVQFVQLASTLLLLKSKSLLPVLELTEEEEESVDDLELRLKRYAIFRDIALMVNERYGSRVSHHKCYTPDPEPLFVTDKYTEVDMLQAAMKEVLRELPTDTPKPTVEIQKVISLEEMVRTLQQRIEQQFALTFSELTTHTNDKVNVIVGFLAVLESVKQGHVLAEQSQRFTDFHITKIEASLPQY